MSERYQPPRSLPHTWRGAAMFNAAAPPDFCRLQAHAQNLHAVTGETYCLLRSAMSACIGVVAETDVVAAGQHLVDAIIWSTDFCADDNLDPALLA